MPLNKQTNKQKQNKKNPNKPNQTNKGDDSDGDDDWLGLSIFYTPRYGSNNTTTFLL